MNFSTPRRLTSSCALLLALLARPAFALPVSPSVGAPTYDLAADWSNVNNPIGPWALYKSPGALFTIVQPDWYGNGSNQPAWADASGPNPFPPNPLAPMWAQAVGDIGALAGEPLYNGFVDVGTVFMHAAEEFRTGSDYSSVVWTSPFTGPVEIEGGVWLSQAFQDRPHAWELRKNGVALTGGPLTFGDGYDKTLPFPFAAGSGGAAATSLTVAANDQLELLIYKTGGYFTPATFVGLNFRIRAVPEPGMSLAAAAVGVFVFLRRRRTI
jgi:hypothetical protein